jgi:hypothetical protein
MLSARLRPRLIALRLGLAALPPSRAECLRLSGESLKMLRARLCLANHSAATLALRKISGARELIPRIQGLGVEM